MRHTTLLVAGASLLVLGISAPAMAGPTLDAIKQRGHIVCGVNAGLGGFAVPDDTGKWTGIDVDVCRAASAAVFGTAENVVYVPVTAQERFTALQSGEIDVLARNTTWTLSRDTALGLEFTGVNYYDGQGFMVPTSLNVASATELDGAAVCVQPGTTTELNLADYFRSNGMAYTPVIFQNDDEIRVAFTQGRCDVFTTDQSGLAANRLALPNPDDWEILPEIISKEPLGPAVRQGDSQWADIMRWSLYAMIEAEELGVTSQNVEEMKSSENPSVRRLLGVEDKMGENLGVPADWAVQIISQVGNYGESFERNLGQGSPLQLERGVNALWTNGGLHYAMPIR